MKGVRSEISVAVAERTVFSSLALDGDGRGGEKGLWWPVEGGADSRSCSWFLSEEERLRGEGLCFPFLF